MTINKKFKTKRTSLTIPVHILDNLDRIATTLQLSRSALVSHMLDEPTQIMSTMLSELQDDIDTSGSPSRRSTVHTRHALQVELSNMQNSLNEQQQIWSKRNEH